MLLGQKVKCVFPEKKTTLIRIINELQAEKFGVAEQTGIILGTNTSHPLPECTLHEKPDCKEVWRKPIAFVIHKVAKTQKEGTATLGPAIFPGDQTFSVNHGSTGRGSSVTDLSQGTKPAAWFWAKWNCLGKSIHLGNVEPKLLPTPSTCGRFLLFFKSKTSSLTSFRFIFNYF